MPSFFGRKRRESTPASSTAPPPPPKDAKFHVHAPTHSNPSTLHSQSLPAARRRRTSTPAYSRSNSLSYPSASSSSSSSSASGPAGSPTPRTNPRPSPPHRPVSSYTSQPRRPSPLSGPPLVASSAPPTESSHSGSHSQTTSKHEPRPGGRWLSLTRRPRSETIVPGRTGASTAETAETAEVTRPEAIQRSVSVVGDDWTRAYEAVEYDLEFHLDLDQRFSDKKASGSRPSDERSRPRDAEDESDDEVPGETDAMLGRDSETVQPTKKRAGLEEQDHSPDKSALSSTRHARTPSAGWKAWSGDPDVAKNTEASSSTPSATRTTPTLDTLPLPAAATSGTSNPAPVVSATTSSSRPASLHSTPSSQSTPSLHSTLSSHSSSSQKRMSMSSHDKNAPLPPLPSPVRSPLLDRTQSKAVDPGSPLVAPLTPPKDSRVKIEEHVGPHVLADVQPQELGVAFPHLQGGASFLSSSMAPFIQTSPPPSSHHSPAASSLPPTDVPQGAAPTEANVPSASVPIETSPQSTPSSSLASSSPAPSQDQSSPPFLVLSYRGQPKSPPAIPPGAPPTPVHTSSASAPPAGVLPLSLPTPGAAFAPPSGASPQPHDSHLPLTESSMPTSSPPPPPLLSSISPSPRPSSVHFPSTVRSAAPSAPHPHPHNPRGSMILYHVSLPSSSGTRPALPNAHTYQSFGRLSAHTNLGGMAVGEDGMLLPPTRSSNPPSPSSSAFNLLSSSGTHDAPAPPPANRYSAYSRNSTYSASADSIVAPSYSSTGPSSPLGLDDRDSKYAVGAMIGTVRSSHFQTLPRIGTPLAASFAFQDIHKGVEADAPDGTADGGSVRASLAPEFTGGSIRGGGVIAYPYDPDEDDSDEEDGAGGYGGDWLHDPDVWPYADGADDFHARRGDWKWWGAAKARDKSPGGSLPKTDVEGVQMEMLASTSVSTASRGSASMLKAPLPHAPSSRRGDGPHSYLPPYRPPTTLETVFGRGAASALSLFIIIAGLLALFIVYPITQVYGPEAGVAAKILGNTAINSTGQAVL